MEQFRFVLPLVSNDEFRLTEGDIASFEQKYQLILPEILKSYYLQHNGARIADVGFDADEITYSVCKITPLRGDGNTVEAMLDRAARYEDMPAWLIPLADDRANGLYFWDSRNEHVYFRYVDETESYTFISRNLAEFFGILNEAYWRDGSSVYEITEKIRRDLEMEKIDFYPLGSIVLLKGGIRKVMIIARGLNVKKDEKTYFFDYGGVLYPDGLTGDQMVYFNHDGITKVYFHGYMDDDNDLVLDNLNTYITEHPDLERADPEKWTAE